MSAAAAVGFVRSAKRKRRSIGWSVEASRIFAHSSFSSRRTAHNALPRVPRGIAVPHARALDGRTERVTRASARTREATKARCHKGSAPSSIANIDLNHKDRPRYSIVGLRLIVQFLLLPPSFSLPLSPSRHFAFTLGSLTGAIRSIFFQRQRPINPLIPRGLCATCGISA